jgi:hypothetical protein
VYVDDITIAYEREEDFKELERTITNCFEVSNCSDLKWLLGVKVEQDLKQGTVKMSQQAYIENAEKEFKMEGSNPKRIPITTATTSSLEKSSEYQVCTLAFISLLAILVLPKIWYVYLHHTSHSLYIYIYICLSQCLVIE